MFAKRFFTLLCVFAFFTDLSGQTELEIKTTGKYIYSWAIEKERNEAYEASKLGLLDTIFISLLKESQIDQTDTIFIKVVNYFEQKIGFKWQVIAFVEKSAVKVKLEDRKKLKAIPVIIGDQNESYKLKSVQSNSLKNNPSPNDKSNDIAIENNRRNAKTGNLVLDELLAISDAALLEQKLKKLRAELILNYGIKSNYPDDSECYIFVIDRNIKEVIAVFDKGKSSRRNFLTNGVENNYAESYSNEYLVYVVIK